MAVLRWLGRAHQECGASRREVARRRPPGCRGAVGHGGRDQSPARSGARDFARAGRPRARHDRRHGEQASSGLLAIALQAEGVAARSYAGWQVPVRTDSSYTKARITSIDDARIRADLDAGRVVIVTGFQGVDADGHITTLGRGGSDTSAVAVAAAIKADECLIYTDVDVTRPTRASCRSAPHGGRRSRKCSRWPRWAPRSCRSARSNSPAIPCADAGAVLADRPAHPARRRNAFGHADYF